MSDGSTAVSTAVPASSRAERIASSRARAGNVFQNRLPTRVMSPAQGARTIGRFLLERAEREPDGPLPTVAVDQAVLTGPAHAGARTTWLGHSTLLIELEGKRVLTDPVWSDRASPLSFSGPKRFQPVPVDLAALPLPDVVLVSHDHYDHLDRDTVVALAARGARFVTALGVGAHLERWGIAADRVTELDWWEHVDVAGLRLRALPSRHFSGRGLTDRFSTLWAAWSIEGSKHRVFFGGDGGWDEDGFAEIGKKVGPFDLAMLEIGAWDPAWEAIHLGPYKAVMATALLEAQALLPIHWGTFNLALHAWYQPAEQLLAAAKDARTKLALPRIGASVVAGDVLPDEPWWRTAMKQR